MASYTVTTDNDSGDNLTVTGDLAAETADGGGLSLREAILLSNATGAADDITFAAALAGSTITLTGGQLVLSNDTTVDGDVDGDNKADVTVDGDDNGRVFNILGAAVTIDSLNITGGYSGSDISQGTGGGGIRVADDSGNDGSLVLRYSSVYGNTSRYRGGGGVNAQYSSDLTIYNSAIFDNTANQQSGGGVYARDSNLIVTNSTISGNTASTGGGGIAVQQSFNQVATAHITNSTITGNETLNNTQGGGIIAFVGDLTIHNSIFLGNTAFFAPELAISGLPSVDVSNSITTGAASDVFAAIDGATGGGQLADNGGTIQTVAIKTTSASVNAGDNSLLNEATVGKDLNGDGDLTDIIGQDANGNARIANTTVDAGAVETPLPEAASLTVTTTSDVVDQFDGETSLREAIGLVNDGTLTGTISFANGAGEAFENGGTIALTQGQLEISSITTVDGDLDNDGTADVTVDAQGNSRVFEIAANDVTIQGLVITGGNATGGIAAGLGGGILVADQTSADQAFQVNGFTLQDSTVTGNSSERNGGGVFVGGFDTRIENSTISANTAGTGMFGGSGGGVSGGAIIVDSLISGNYATNGGGLNGARQVLNTTISGNTATGSGGGAYGSGRFVNSTIIDNTADRGGAFKAYTGPLYTSFINTTVTNNYATTFVGGIIYDSKGDQFEIANSIILGNADSDHATQHEIFLEGFAGSRDLIATGTNIVGASASSNTGFNANANIVTARATDVFETTVANNNMIAGVASANGGLGDTVKLKIHGDAIDVGDATQLDETVINFDLNGDGDQLDTIALDATGGTRVLGAGVDLGAVEAAVPEAASLVVTTTSDVSDFFDGETTLREAIEHLNTGRATGNISFANGVGEAFENGGTITLTQGQLQLTAATSIDGDLDNDGTADVTIDAGGNSRVLSTNTDLTLDGLVITGGYSTVAGGGLRFSMIAGGNGVIRNSVITGNTSTSSGGGVHAYGNLTVEDTVFSMNAGLAGGGLSFIDGSVTILRSAFTDNTATSGNGGGAFLNDATVVDSTFSGNTAGNRGGGLFAQDTILVNTTVADNTAGTGGGIAYSYGLKLFNTTVTNNSATTIGGVAGVGKSGMIDLNNSIILGNQSANGNAELDHVTNPQTITATGANIVGENGTVFDASGIANVDNASASSVFAVTEDNNGVTAGSLGDNGGPVQTVALLAGGAAVDAGDQTLLDETVVNEDLNGDGDLLDTIASDATGNTRVNGANVDLGAVETTAVPDTPSLVVTTTADVVDSSDGETSLREAIDFINDGTLTGTITFASGAGEAFENGGTIALNSGLQISQSTTIDGDVDSNGTPDVTLDGQGGTFILSSNNTTLELNGLALTNARSLLGTTGSDVTITSSSFTGSVPNGPNTTNGAVQIYNAPNLLIQDSDFSNNAGSGLALRNGVSDARILNSTFSGNGFGGIRVVDGVGDTLIYTSTISGNSSNFNGAGIYADIYQATVSVVNSTVHGNSSSGFGGGIVMLRGELDLTNSTVTGNSGTSTYLAGGVVGSKGATVNLANSVILGNTNGDLDGSATFSGQNIVGEDATAFDATVSANVSNAPAANVFAATFDDNGVDVGVLADNGGPVQTVALLAGGSAVDVGDATLLDESVINIDLNGDGDLLDTVTSDATGANRVQGAGVDLGAFETTFVEAASLVVTTTADVVDSSDGETSLREAIGFIDDGTLTGTITFASGAGEAFETGGTIALTQGQLTVTNESVSIDGDVNGDGAPDVTIDAQGNGRVLQISNFGFGTPLDVALNGLILTGGDTPYSGGGLRATGGMNLVITNSEFDGNTAARAGGGLSASGYFGEVANVTLLNTTFANNSTTGSDDGGGASFGDDSTARITNTTFYGNTSQQQAGALRSNSADVYILASTFTGNYAVNGNDAIRNYSDAGPNEGRIVLQYSIVTGNGSGGPEVSGISYFFRNIVGTDIKDGLSLSLGTTSAADVFDSTATVNGATAGVLALNGGGVRTVKLDPTGDAIDIGASANRFDENSQSVDLNGDGDFNDVIMTDAAGSVRVQGGYADLGAFESTPPEAPSLIVTTTADVVDIIDGETSLREAIGLVNDGTLSGTITFAAGVGEAFENGATINTTSELVLSSNISIDGDVDGDDKADVTLDAGGTHRVINITGGAATLDSLTITNGDAGAYDGGGISVAAGSTLVLRHSTVSENQAALFGGGIYNVGNSLTVYGSTISGNSAQYGGGISTRDAYGQNFITNTTIANNSAGGRGGGFYSQYTNVAMTNVTLSGNSAAIGGGGISHYGGRRSATFTATNVLAVGNSAGSDADVFANGPRSFTNSITSGLASDIFDAVDATTGGGLLADNGGPVQTIALNTTGAAVNGGDASFLSEIGINRDLNGDGDALDTIAVDARGGPRVLNGAVDIGAIEVEQFSVSDGDDFAFGTAGNDVVETGDGSDLFLAGDGNDSISGGDGVDALAGEGGNDTLDGGEGNDLLSGGEGDDLIYGGIGDDVMAGGPGADAFFGGDGNDTVSYEAATTPLFIDLSNPSRNNGEADGDTYDSVERIVGSSTQSNTITGDAGPNTLVGGDAADRLNGAGGNDTLEGGLGDDLYTIDSLDDLVIEAPDEGFDRILTPLSLTLPDNVEAANLLGTDDLSLTGNELANWLRGNSGNNTLTGLDGNDRLEGLAGNDTLIAGAGNDNMLGGEGDDVFVVTSGTDLLRDFTSGEDIIDIRGIPAIFDDLTITDIALGARVDYAGGAILIQNVTAASLSASDFFGRLDGTEGDDVLSVASGPVEIFGFGGDDLLRALSGPVTLTGGIGNDAYFVFETDTTIIELADEGIDRVYTEIDLVLADNIEIGAVQGTDDIDITGNALDNNLRGGSGSNVLRGEDGTDVIRGLDGDDTLGGGAGIDILTGGAGADVFEFIENGGTNFVTDFEDGVDALFLDISGIVFSNMTIIDLVDLTLIDYGSGQILLDGISANQITQADFDSAFSFPPLG
ncbi:MAG: choice-of-anchor Q domain-containing protein [Pseudomonadota bacterium]